MYPSDQHKEQHFQHMPVEQYINTFLLKTSTITYVAHIAIQVYVQF